MELNQENFNNSKSINPIQEENENNFSALITFGYISQEDNGSTNILFKLEKDVNIIDKGLVVGLLQNKNLVDAYFLGIANIEKLGIKLNEKYIIKDNKKYLYEDLGINIQPDCGFITNKDEEKILELSDEAFKMFASVYGLQEDNTCVISVLDGKICVCCLRGEEVLWVNQINIGNNKFNPETRNIIVGNEKYSLENCYLRVCMKNIYLHVDIDNKSKILGKTNNPFYDY